MHETAGWKRIFPQASGGKALWSDNKIDGVLMQNNPQYHGALLARTNDFYYFGVRYQWMNWIPNCTSRINEDQNFTLILCVF